MSRFEWYAGNSIWIVGGVFALFLVGSFVVGVFDRRRRTKTQSDLSFPPLP